MVITQFCEKSSVPLFVYTFFISFFDFKHQRYSLSFFNVIQICAVLPLAFSKNVRLKSFSSSILPT